MNTFIICWLVAFEGDAMIGLKGCRCWIVNECRKGTFSTAIIASLFAGLSLQNDYSTIHFHTGRHGEAEKHCRASTNYPYLLLISVYRPILRQGCFRWPRPFAELRFREQPAPSYVPGAKLKVSARVCLLVGHRMKSRFDLNVTRPDEKSQTDDPRAHKTFWKPQNAIDNDRTVVWIDALSIVI